MAYTVALGLSVDSIPLLLYPFVWRRASVLLTWSCASHGPLEQSGKMIASQGSCDELTAGFSVCVPVQYSARHAGYLALRPLFYIAWRPRAGPLTFTTTVQAIPVQASRQSRNGDIARSRQSSTTAGAMAVVDLQVEDAGICNCRSARPAKMWHARRRLVPLGGWADAADEHPGRACWVQSTSST